MKLTMTEFRGIVEWFLHKRSCPFDEPDDDFMCRTSCDRCRRLTGVAEKAKEVERRKRKGYLFCPCIYISNRELRQRAAALLMENA